MGAVTLLLIMRSLFPVQIGFDSTGISMTGIITWGGPALWYRAPIGSTLGICA